MIEISVKTNRNPRVLAELIASMHGDDVNDQDVAQATAVVKNQQAAVADARPSWQQDETLDFKKLDDDNDWSDV